MAQKVHLSAFPDLSSTLSTPSHLLECTLKRSIVCPENKFHSAFCVLTMNLPCQVLDTFMILLYLLRSESSSAQSPTYPAQLLHLIAFQKTSSEIGELLFSQASIRLWHTGTSMTTCSELSLPGDSASDTPHGHEQRKHT